MKVSAVLFASFFSFLVATPSELNASMRGGRGQVTPLRSSPESVVVMTFNVENLFDTKHDEGKEDYTFLPIEKKQTQEHKEWCQKIKIKRFRNDCLFMDWSEAKLSEKLNRVAGTILQVNSGKGPDILILEEVENRELLERLRQDYLGAAGYESSVLLPSEDVRGINVAMLSRLPLVSEPNLYNIEFNLPEADSSANPIKTRGILRSDFRLPSGDTVTVLGVHFPSPMHPSLWRTQAFDTLMKIRSELPADRYVVAGGDFNVSAQEDRKAKHFKQQAKDWLVSHQVGCKGCKGTEYYLSKRAWSFLDVLMFSKNMSSPKKGQWTLDPNSIQILNEYSPQMNPDKTPARFRDEKTPLGVSDHFPIAAQIVFSAAE